MKRLGLALALWASLSCAAVAQVGGLSFPGPGGPHTSGGGGGCSVAFTSGPPVQLSSSIITFASQNIGAASASRIVAVVAQASVAGSGLTFSTTIGGSTATLAVQEFSILTNLAAVWYLAVPTGTTANIVLTVAGTSPNFNELQIAVYALTGCTTNPSGGSTVGTTAWGVVNPGSMVVTATVPTGGVGIGVFGTDRPTSATFSTGTLDFQQNDTHTGDDIYAVHIATSGSQTLTSSSVATFYNAAMAVWGP